MRKISVAIICCLLFASGALASKHPDRTVHATIAADGIQHVTLVGGSYFFDPNRIIVTVGVPVQLTVSKEKGWVPHNLVIKAPDAGIDVSESLSSQAKTVEFTPTKVGDYPFYCNKKLLFFASHRKKGMEGVLEVVPAQ